MNWDFHDPWRSQSWSKHQSSHSTARGSPTSSPMIAIVVPSIPYIYTHLHYLSFPHAHPYFNWALSLVFTQKRPILTKHLAGLAAFLDICRGTRRRPILYCMPLVITQALSLLSSSPSPSNITFLPCTCFESHWTPTHHGSTEILCYGYYKPSYENGSPRNTDTNNVHISSAHTHSLVPLDFTYKAPVPR